MEYYSTVKKNSFESVLMRLQTAEERREIKGKGERERYTQLNAEFQKIVRKDKEAFLKEQHK